MVRRRSWQSQQLRRPKPLGSGLLATPAYLPPNPLPVIAGEVGGVGGRSRYSDVGSPTPCTRFSCPASFWLPCCGMFSHKTPAGCPLGLGALVATGPLREPIPYHPPPNPGNPSPRVPPWPALPTPGSVQRGRGQPGEPPGCVVLSSCQCRQLCLDSTPASLGSQVRSPSQGAHLGSGPGGGRRHRLRVATSESRCELANTIGTTSTTSRWGPSANSPQGRF